MLWYANQVYDIASEAAGVDIAELQKDASIEEKKSFDQMLAAASQSVTAESQQVFAQIPPIIEKTVQMLQELSPKPQMPPDPRVEAMMAETQRKQAADQAGLQVKQAEMQQRAQMDQMSMQQRMQQQEIDIKSRLAELEAKLRERMMVEDREDRRAAADIEARVAMNESDNQTAKQLAALEVASGEKIGVSTGTGINPNP